MAFFGCSNLKYIACKAAKAPELSITFGSTVSNAFDGVFSTCKIHILASSLRDYSSKWPPKYGRMLIPDL